MMEILSNSEAISHCTQLSQLIDQAVEKNGGYLPFSQYMHLALYTPHLGYYAAGSYKFGAAGDFITAPEISPFFGATIAQSFVPLLSYFKDHKKATSILEFGAGSGALAKSILEELLDKDIVLDEYLILEVSPDLQDRQRQLLEPLCKELRISTNLRWINQLPSSFTGIYLANEVIDAFPVELIVKRASGWYERGLSINPKPSSPSFSDHWKLVDGKKLNLQELPTYLQQIDNHLPLGYETEIHPQAHAWVLALASHLHEGIFLTIDYGFPEKEYYHPQRSQGTIIAHHHHHSIPDVFYLPGLCDLTSHVEWSTINRIATQVGFELIGYTSQAAFLLNAGITDLLMAKFQANNPVDYLPQANAISKLISEAEMGELFKAIAWCKSPNQDFLEFAHSLPGFTGKLRSL